MSWLKGRKRSAETRDRMSRAKKGKKRPDLSERNRTKPPTKGKKLPKRPDLSKRNREIPPMLGKKNPNLSEYMKNGGAAYALSFVKNPSKEQACLFRQISKLYTSAILNYPYQNYSIDIAIPELKIAIEFDGYYWHRDKEEQDRKRQSEIEKDGWKFLRYNKLPKDNDLLRDLFNLQGKKLIILEIKENKISTDWWTPEIKNLFCGLCNKQDCKPISCLIANPYCG